MALFDASASDTAVIFSSVHCRLTVMRHAPSTMHLSFAFRQPPAAGGIEWEELPSLASRVRPSTPDSASIPWDSTRPASLETITVSPPFRELQGVAIREVSEPDVFRHFFGS